jgi:hypothetical protein
MQKSFVFLVDLLICIHLSCLMHLIAYTTQVTSKLTTTMLLKSINPHLSLHTIEKTIILLVRVIICQTVLQIGLKWLSPFQKYFPMNLITYNVHILLKSNSKRNIYNHTRLFKPMINGACIKKEN